MQKQSSNSVFILRGLRKRYGDRTVLDIPETHIEAGKITVIVGSNGAGKSTLLRILAFLDEPTEGEVIFKGKLLDFSRGIDIATLRRVTLVMQEHFIFSTSVIGNVLYGLRKRGIERDQAMARAREALQAVGLGEMANREARKLSGGEGKRLAMARALALEPDVILLDEPTANVDNENTRAIESLIKSIRDNRGTTVVMTTHDRRQAQRLGDRVLTIADGRLIDTPNFNVFAGEIRGDEKQGHLELAPGVLIFLDTGIRGRAHIAVEPSSIILSRTRLESSARNVLHGRIVRVEIDGGHVRVVVDVGVEIVALVTTESYRELGLSVGEEVWTTFKSTSVSVL